MHAGGKLLDPVAYLYSRQVSHHKALMQVSIGERVK